MHVAEEAGKLLLVTCDQGTGGFGGSHGARGGGHHFGGGRQRCIALVRLALPLFADIIVETFAGRRVAFP